MKLGNFFISDLSTEGLIHSLEERLNKRKQVLLFFINTNFVVKCQGLAGKISTSPSLIVNDGIGIELGNKLVNGQGFKQNLNATDFMPSFLKSLESKKIILFGSLHEDLVPTANLLRSDGFKHNIVGQFDGYKDLNKKDFIEQLNSLHADILLVGMGNPLQEEWILKYHEQLNIPLISGVGALFKFMSGNQRRAPKLMRKYRLEWLHRLLTEPVRLFMRYTFDIFKFFLICVKSK